MTRCTAARNRFVSVVYCVLCNALSSPARTACVRLCRLCPAFPVSLPQSQPGPLSDAIYSDQISATRKLFCYVRGSVPCPKTSDYRISLTVHLNCGCEEVLT